MTLGVGVALVAPATAEAQKPATAPPESKGSSEVDPKAMEQLERMQRYLQSLKSFTLDAETTKDEIVHDDFKVQRAERARVVVRADRLRAEVSDSDGNRLYVYDGRSLALETKKGARSHYATTPAPATLRETVDAAMDRHELELPLSDVLYVATGGKVVDKVVAAADLGPSQVGGVPCEHLAFRTKAVDWQVCVEHGDRPVPRKLVLTTRGSPSGLQSSAVLDWDLKTPVTDEAFAFKPSEGATRINFGPPASASPKAKAKAKAP